MLSFNFVRTEAAASHSGWCIMHAWPRQCGITTTWLASCKVVACWVDDIEFAAPSVHESLNWKNVASPCGRSQTVHALQQVRSRHTVSCDGVPAGTESSIVAAGLP